MRSRPTCLFSVGLLLAAGALPCSTGEHVVERLCAEERVERIRPPEDCCNRIDDDGDGWVDFQDSECASHPECGPEPFHRGDVRQNGRIDITDAIQILGFLFGGSPVGCQEAADVDDDGEVLVTDAILLLRYLFSDGPTPAAPGPPGKPCGFDPQGSPSLGCSFYSPCHF